MLPCDNKFFSKMLARMAMCRLANRTALLTLLFNPGDWVRRGRRMVRLPFTHGDCLGSVLDWSIIDE